MKKVISNLYENEHYYVIITDNAIGEDGQFGADGYAVINKITSITEHTSTLLPQALFQADHLSGSLKNHMEKDIDVDAIEAVDNDVLIN